MCCYCVLLYHLKKAKSHSACSPAEGVSGVVEHFFWEQHQLSKMEQEADLVNTCITERYTYMRELGKSAAYLKLTCISAFWGG